MIITVAVIILQNIAALIAIHIKQFWFLLFYFAYVKADIKMETEEFAWTNKKPIGINK